MGFGIQDSGQHVLLPVMRRIRIILIVLGVIALSLWIAWRWAASPPSWYNPPPAQNEQTLAFADRVENNLIAQVQEIRPAHDRYTIRLREDQINAWLAARLPRWIAHHEGWKWPEELGTPQMRVEPSGMMIAVPAKSAGARIVVAQLLPQLNEQGQLQLQLTRVGLGRIWLPGEPVANLLNAVGGASSKSVNGGDHAAILDVLTGNRTLEPLINLADRRRMRILALTLHDGAIDITAETE